MQVLLCRICWKWEWVCYTKRAWCIIVVGFSVFRYCATSAALHTDSHYSCHLNPPVTYTLGSTYLPYFLTFSCPLRSFNISPDYTLPDDDAWLTQFLFLFLCLWHCWNTMPEAFCVRVCPSASESVSESMPPENLVNTISQRLMKRISATFGHRCIWAHRCAD